MRAMAMCALVMAAGAAFAQPDPSGIDFATIGAVNNAPWPGNGTPNDRAIGRGSVGYEYKIGRYEVTTAQWVEFFNAAYDRPASERLPHLLVPQFWGATGTTPNTPGGRRWAVPVGNEMRPVADISWRMAAMYCNWLHNDKSTDRSAFLDGAYDVSTFGLAEFGFTDQLRHHPDARYWIPTWDEWLKAAHYDPNKNGPGQEGWWNYSTSSDVVPAYGPPGVRVGMAGQVPVPDPNGRLAEANGVWDTGAFNASPFTIPLGAYPNVQSPWGLFDTAGATAEWCEDAILVNGLFPMYRIWDGSPWTGVAGGGGYPDTPAGSGGDIPMLSQGILGFRVAAAVPAPGTSAVALAVCGLLFRRRRPRDGR